VVLWTPYWAWTIIAPSRSWGSVMDLHNWLLSLGLEQYEEAFRENTIDDALLPSLTAEDLKDLGIKNVGHRRKLLNAINALGISLSSFAVGNAPFQEVAERRQVSIMFSDLVGSTALSARMDPEDLREVIAAYHKCVAETVESFGGFVSQYLGDGVLVYFGYPQAHEDDAERAVRSGLQVVEAVSSLETQVSLQSRVGIATGLVVVGDRAHSGRLLDYSIIGETPNVAARLQGVAEPNEVIIAESTRRLIGDLFELKHLGARDLKGIAEPVHSWVVLRASSVASRFEALHSAGLTALIGREEELNLLLQRWSMAKNGEGQAVLLSGEAGIGKSRLTAELLQRLSGEPLTRVRYFCSPHHADSALYPITAQMERAAGFVRNDNLQRKLDKLDALLTQTATPTEDAELFTDMLLLPNDGRYRRLNLSAKRRRDRTLQALTKQIEALARLNPVLMIFEDAHWADPTSLEALSLTINRIASHRVLLIVTFRPDFDAPWSGHPHVTTLTINRLGQREVSAMIDSLVGNKLLAERVRGDIIERTDGIPLFVEEITKAVLESESHRAAERAIAAIPPPEVPASLHASLMERLDRLGSAKEIAQIGAAIGREFSYALLAMVARKPEAQLGAALDRLLAAGLLFRQGEPPDAVYLFKHALVQDAAHGTLLREPRRALHARIADVLKSEFADTVERRPELLARHCAEAGLLEEAARLWGKAGQRSLDLVALPEAVAYLQDGLAIIKRLPLSADRDSLELALREPLHSARLQWRGWASPEVGANARAILHLAQRQGRPQGLLVGLWGTWINTITQGRVAETSDWARRLLAEGDRSGNIDLQILGHRASLSSHFYLGELNEALEQRNKALALYDETRAARWRELTGNDVRTAVGVISSQALWMLGYPDQASQVSDQLDADTHRLGHPFDIGWASTWGAYVLDYRCESDRMLARVREADRVGREQSIPVFNKVLVPAGEGLAMLRKGLLPEAISLLERGIEGWRATGGHLNLPYLKGALAEAISLQGDTEAGLHLLAECLDQIERPGWHERVWLPEILRLKGWMLMRQGLHAEAEAALRQSIEWSRRQQARSWELRSSTTLAQRFVECGRSDEARQLLLPIHDWFSEGFETHDLKAARALLAEIC
jgi:class 3 adenylate cyclase/tetratricopeptide (TPR) repeat protein